MCYEWYLSYLCTLHSNNNIMFCIIMVFMHFRNMKRKSKTIEYLQFLQISVSWMLGHFVATNDCCMFCTMYCIIYYIFNCNSCFICGNVGLLVHLSVGVKEFQKVIIALKVHVLMMFQCILWSRMDVYCILYSMHYSKWYFIYDNSSLCGNVFNWWVVVNLFLGD